MATIVTRAGKGSALTHTEMDANFTNLNAELPSSNDWVDLSNSYSWSFTSTHPTGYDSGMLDISTILSGLPTDWKYLAIIQKAKMTYAPSSSYYAYQSGVNYLRLGTSSSSYTEKSSHLDFAWQNAFYSSTYSSPYGDTHEHWGFFVINQSGPSAIFQPALFNNAAVGGAAYATEKKAADNFNLVLPPVGIITSTQYWNTNSIASGTGPTSWGSGTLSNLSYCGYRFDGNGYSSQNGAAPSFTVTMKASYIAE